MSARSIVIFDVETTGLDPSADRIVEAGAVLYSLADRTVVESFSALVNADGNAAESVNKIPASALTRAPTIERALNRLGELHDVAAFYGEPVWMAHRAEFDRSFLAAVAPKLVERAPWVCSKFDVEWPLSRSGASCVEMAVAHGVPVVSAHRALTDCMLIAKTIEATQALGHDVDAMIVRALRPRSRFVAVGSDGTSRSLPRSINPTLKEHSFRWDPDRGEWWRVMVADDTATLPFAVREVAA